MEMRKIPQRIFHYEVCNAKNSVNSQTELPTDSAVSVSYGLVLFGSAANAPILDATKYCDNSRPN
jgi:hypothetical protein